MKTSVLHPRVVVNATQSKVPAFLSRASTIHDAMTGASSTFPAPVPPMTTLLSLIQAATVAQQATATRAIGLAAARDVKIADLASALASERAYVQQLVDASPELGQHLAELAGMRLMARGTRVRPVLTLSVGEPSGIVVAKANAAALRQGKRRSVTYNWRYTPDGGKTWILAPSTPVAHATLAGLAPLTRYGVEVCVTSSAGTTAWSDAATIVVH